MTYQKKFKKENYVQSIESIEDVLTYPIKAIPERGIKQFTAEHFEIRTLFSEASGKVEAYYFPVKKEGKIIGFSKRDMRYPKKHDNHFSAVGNVDIKSDLWGQDKCKAGKTLIITEGQFDAAITWQALMEHQKNPGEYVPNVVSIGFGTKNAAEHVGNNLDFVEKYSEARIVFDGDEAKPAEAKKGIMKGKEATGEVCLLLGSRAKVVELEKDKDPCDYKDNLKELSRLVSWTAKEYAPEVLIRGGIGLDNLLTPVESGTMVSCLPETMRVMHGLRPAELTVILAPTNVGKSTICREVQYALAKDGKHVANYFIEEDSKKTQQAMIALDNNVLLPKFREDPNIITREAAEKSYMELIDNGRTLWIDTAQTFGKLTPKEFIKSLKWAHAMGAEFAILDHISMIFSASENDNERKEIDQLLTELAAFVTTTRMHLIVVAHIKRMPIIAPKDKEGNVKYPYWVKVDKEAGRGSGAFEQLAHNIIVLEPEILESGDRGRMRTRVVKNREWGYIGLGDVLTMHPVTGRLVNAKTNEEEF
jgi:archaellum biogenesis ATPase FlaH